MHALCLGWPAAGHRNIGPRPGGEVRRPAAPLAKPPRTASAITRALTLPSLRARLPPFCVLTGRCVPRMRQTQTLTHHSRSAVKQDGRLHRTTRPRRCTANASARRHPTPLSSLLYRPLFASVRPSGSSAKHIPMPPQPMSESWSSQKPDGPHLGEEEYPLSFACA